VPLGVYHPRRRKRQMDHLLACRRPASVELIVTGPPQGRRSALRTRCVDTGPAGDPSPAAILADIVSGPLFFAGGNRHRGRPPVHPVYKQVHVAALQKSEPQFVVTFTEDEKGFYINSGSTRPMPSR